MAAFFQGALAAMLTLSLCEYLYLPGVISIFQMRKRGKSRSCYRSSHLNIRTNLSLFTRPKGCSDSIDQVAPDLSQPPVLPAACQPAKSQCRNSLSARRSPGWQGGPSGFGEGQRAGPQMRGHREVVKKKILGKCIKTVLRAKLWLWTEGWQKSEIALFKVRAVRTSSLKSILLSFQPGSCIWWVPRKLEN